MESLKEKIKELCSYAKSFREYDNAVSVNPQSPLAIYCRYRALEAALNMAMCADSIWRDIETK